MEIRHPKGDARQRGYSVGLGQGDGIDGQPARGSVLGQSQSTGDTAKIQADAVRPGFNGEAGASLADRDIDTGSAFLELVQAGDRGG